MKTLSSLLTAVSIAAVISVSPLAYGQAGTSSNDVPEPKIDKTPPATINADKTAAGANADTTPAPLRTPAPSTAK